MNELFLFSETAGVVLSLTTYGLGVWLRQKTKKEAVNPLLISIVLCIAFLCLFHVSYDSYRESAKYLSYLLTPATVALAIPLYRQINILKENRTAILLSVAAGVLTSLISILLLSVLFGLTHEQYVTLLPKSITTAIGIGVSRELGGIETITVAVIIITGILGNVTAVLISRLLRIQSPISRGLMIGTASHAIGTSKAVQMGETEGAMSGLAIVVAGLMTVIAASFFAMLH